MRYQSPIPRTLVRKFSTACCSSVKKCSACVRYAMQRGKSTLFGAPDCIFSKAFRTADTPAITLSLSMLLSIARRAA